MSLSGPLRRRGTSFVSGSASASHEFMYFSQRAKPSFANTALFIAFWKKVLSTSLTSYEAVLQEDARIIAANRNLVCPARRAYLCLMDRHCFIFGEVGVISKI